jgi:hypothetical protein
METYRCFSGFVEYLVADRLDPNNEEKRAVFDPFERRESPSDHRSSPHAPELKVHLTPHLLFYSSKPSTSILLAISRGILKKKKANFTGISSGRVPSKMPKQQFTINRTSPAVQGTDKEAELRFVTRGIVLSRAATFAISSSMV